MKPKRDDPAVGFGGSNNNDGFEGYEEYTQNSIHNRSTCLFGPLVKPRALNNHAQHHHLKGFAHTEDALAPPAWATVPPDLKSTLWGTRYRAAFGESHETGYRSSLCELESVSVLLLGAVDPFVALSA